MKLGRAKRLAHKSLFDTFSSVVSASGHAMDYRYDISLCMHPIGADGQPLKQGFLVVVHVVSDYQGEGVLIGIQQHRLWQLETSYKTGMKTITSDGTEYTFPYSVKTNGTLLEPGTAKVITKVITEVEPQVGADVEMTPAEGVADLPSGNERPIEARCFFFGRHLPEELPTKRVDDDDPEPVSPPLVCWGAGYSPCS
jgi:hypothetical protein